MKKSNFTYGTSLPRWSGIVFMILAILFAFGQTAFGLTVTAPVDSLPIGASVNDFDGDHNFMVAFHISLLSTDITWADGDDITIACPTGVYIASTDGDADYNDEISMSWAADQAIGPVTIAAGATSQLVTVDIAAAASGGTGLADGDHVTVFFPIITSPSLVDGDTTSFVITVVDVSDNNNNVSALAHVTFRDNINLVTFAANYDGGDDTTDTDGDQWPDGGAAAITVALPDFIVDADLAGANEGAVNAGEDWDAVTLDADNATNEITYTLWASKYDTVTKISAASAEALEAINVTSAVQITDNEGGTMNAENLDASLLEEGDWYFYVTSNVTADWVLGMSDAVHIRHYPFFTATDNAAIGIDFNGDEVFEPATNDNVSTVVLDVSGGLGKDGTIGSASASDVDFYISVNDFDDEATFQIFRVPSTITPTADSIKLSGTSPSLAVTGLGGGTAVTSQSELAELPYSIVNYSAIRSASDYDPVGDYNIWVVANDGKHQSIQRMKNNGGGSNLTLTISTFPKFNFVSNGDVAFDTAVEEYLLINWGRTIDMDNDVDGTLRIKLYCSNLAWGAANSGASTTPANVDTTKLPADAIANPTHTVHIATIVDTSDTQEANRYMWNVRESGLDATLSPFYIYAIVTSGADAAIVRMNDLENMAESAANIDELTLSHGTYFLPESPVEGEIASLGLGDTYQLKWNAFDLDETTEMKVAAFIVPEGEASPPEAGTDDYASVDNTAGWFWLTNDAAGAGADAIQVWANAADMVDGKLVIDVSDLTDDMVAGGGDVPAGNYDVWFLYDIGSATEAWDGADDGVVKADGKLFFSGDPDKNGTYNYRLEPTQIVMEEGDTLTVSVYASDDDPGGAANDAMWIECYLNVPTEFYGIVDQDPGTASAIEAFTPNTTNFGGTTTKNIAADSTDHYELDLIRHASNLTTETDLNDEVIATFQIYARKDAVSEALESAQITFNTSGERTSRMFDGDFSQLTANVPPAATTLSMTPRGKITGLVDVEARSDSNQVVTIWVCPTGSYDNITDASFVAANGDGDVSDGISVTLDANGRYNFTNVPTGKYDILVAKPGWLDQKATSQIVQAYSTTTVDFYNDDRLLGGDCAGYDDDGDASTVSLPDNQINSTDHSVFEQAFNATPSDTNWNMYCDVDGNDYVEVWDIYYVGNNTPVGNGEGIVYKRVADAKPASAETLAELVELKRDKDIITYAVVAKNIPALQAYSARVFIDSEAWELVEYTESLHDTNAKLNFTKISGYKYDFVCSGYNGVASKEMNPTLVTFTVKAKVANPAELELQDVKLIDAYGRENNPVIINGVENEENALPTEFSLSRNYPNPFNPTTTIEFALPKAGNVKLTVYNMLGQQVRTLVSTKMAAGNFKAMWDAQDSYGRKVSSGMYFYRLEVDNKVIGTQKMLLLK